MKITIPQNEIESELTKKANANFPNFIDERKGAFALGFRNCAEFYESKVNERLSPVLENFENTLIEAKLQIEYLHDKFKETGSGNAAISKIDASISELKSLNK